MSKGSTGSLTGSSSRCTHRRRGLRALPLMVHRVPWLGGPLQCTTVRIGGRASKQQGQGVSAKAPAQRDTWCPNNGSSTPLRQASPLRPDLVIYGAAPLGGGPLLRCDPHLASYRRKHATYTAISLRAACKPCVCSVAKWVGGGTLTHTDAVQLVSRPQRHGCPVLDLADPDRPSRMPLR